jgi:hypothetical protein
MEEWDGEEKTTGSFQNFLSFLFLSFLFIHPFMFLIRILIEPLNALSEMAYPARGIYIDKPLMSLRA